jgi:hypothetical protein
LTTLESVSKEEKEEYSELSFADQKELDKQLIFYKNNSDAVLDWNNTGED